MLKVLFVIHIDWVRTAGLSRYLGIHEASLSAPRQRGGGNIYIYIYQALDM